MSLKSLIRKIVPRLRRARLDDEETLPAELDNATVRRLQRVLGCRIHHRDLFVQAGFPAQKMFVKPNFTENPSFAWRPSGGGAVYAGRLAPEKGIETLLDAWRQLGGTVPLRIVGDGPLADRVRAFAAEVPNVQYDGWVDRARLKEIFQESSFLVVPSTWYEGLPGHGLKSFHGYPNGVPEWHLESGESPGWAPLPPSSKKIGRGDRQLRGRSA